MKKKMFLCVTLLTHLSTYTMLLTCIRAQKQKRMYTSNQKDSHVYSSMSNHLNSCKPESALERLTAIIFSPLQCSREEKIAYINSVLYRIDIPTEHRTTLLLLQTFLNQQKPHHFHDQDPLIHIAIKENNELLLKIALKYGFKDSVNLPNKHGNSALYLAASQGQLPLVQTLIDHKPNLNIQNNEGHTPLHGIATSSLINTTPENNTILIKTMRCIKNAGANTKIKDNANKLPIDYIHKALQKFEPNRSRTLLNEDGELIDVFYDMGEILRTPNKNE